MSKITMTNVYSRVRKYIDTHVYKHIKTFEFVRFTFRENVRYDRKILFQYLKKRAQ